MNLRGDYRKAGDLAKEVHEAVDLKEKVAIKEESQTLADITFQNYFRLIASSLG